ncbi:MAG: YceH family protein [Steroidobacteraceae bacterium]
MNIELSPIEARVIGCLIEKQRTTPDQYPRSLNALVNACNQKSNRDPLMSADEAAIQTTMDHLIRKHLVIEKSGFGSRVPKYQHRLCNTEFGPLKFTPQELAIVCELLLRGPQSPGELRTRAARMASFSEVGQVETALESLSSRANGPFVVRLPREPARRDSRFAHLFSGAVTIPALTEESITGPSVASAPASSRLERLEEEVRQLKEELKDIKARLPPQ